MEGFDFVIRFASGRGVMKSKITPQEWQALYGEPVTIHYVKDGPFLTHVCVPDIVNIEVKFRDFDPWIIGEKEAKGQPFLIFLHNKARTLGAYEEPRHGESSHVYARTVGVILLNDKMTYEVDFHKTGEVSPIMKVISHVKRAAV